MTAEHDTGVRCSHLGRAQRDQLHALLLEQRQTLIQRAAETSGAAEHADAAADGALARTTEALDEVEGALIRMDTGSYGWCTSCGDAIPFERLEAVPAAARCVPCQSRAATLLG